MPSSGPRDVQNAEIEDFVLLRSSGLPTYQLSVVVDDIDMRITHINSRRRSLVQHAEASVDLQSARRRAADLRSRPSPFWGLIARGFPSVMVPQAWAPMPTKDFFRKRSVTSSRCWDGLPVQTLNTFARMNLSSDLLFRA